MQVYQETDQATTQQDENPVPFIGARGFTQVENTVIYNRDLSVGARHTYTVLTAHMYNKDHCWPGMARLAHILGVTEKTARGYIRELEDAGLIHKRRQGQGYTNVYTRKAAYLNHEFRPVNTTDQEQHTFTGPDQALITDKENEVEEKKYKNPPGGADAPPEGGSKEKDQVPESSKTSVPSPDSDNQRHKLARELAEKLDVDLEVVGVLLGDDQREKYRINFKRLVDKGVDDGKLEKVRERIVERGPYHLIRSPQEALQDVRGENGKGKASPSEVVNAIRGHRYFGESGEMKKMKMWEVAERFDFTSDEEPHMQLRKRISSDRKECDEWIGWLRRIAFHAMKEKEEDVDRRRRAMGMESPAAPTESASPAPEEAPEGSTTPEAAEVRETALTWIDVPGDDELIPDGVSAEIQRAAEALQDPDQDAGRVFRGFLDGKLSRERAIEAACYAAYGTFEPEEGIGKTGMVVEDLRYLLAADKERAMA